ncbi:MAG: hypothetical protein CSA62_15025 [Planctomycetota bacterium]|nr:MAG: hypothetical protein CSA62_15025 [Planctomycetota bacterium]
MHSKSILFGILFSTLCLPLSTARAQQRLVLPAEMAGREGLSSAMLPFSLGDCVRLQALYQGIHIGGSRSFTQISFRSDWNRGKAIPEKKFIRVKLALANVPLRWSALKPGFDDNYRNKVFAQVKDSRIILPAQPAQAQRRPRPFNLSIKFDKKQVFVQDWSKGNVLLDLIILGQPRGRYPIDSCFLCESKRIGFGKQGPKCQVQHPGGPKPLKIGAAQTTKLGGLMRFTVENALPGNLCLFVVGTQRDGGSFLGKTLPFTAWDLFDPKHTRPDPAPDCWVNTDWLFLYPKVADSGGRASAGLQIPNNERWLNVFMSAQVLSMDIRANPLGAVFSRGIRSNVCGPLPVGMVYKTFKDPKKVPGRGSVLLGEAPIIELR